MAALATVAQGITPFMFGAELPMIVARPSGSGNALDPDARLVERCLRGDEAAWEDLVRNHVRRVHSMCFRFTNSAADAQDIAQEVFFRVFRSLKSYRAGEGSFTVWLGRLTRNLLIDHYRRSKSDRVTESIEDQLPMLEERSSPDSRADAALAGREANEVLQAALQKLSPELRETVILRDLEGLEYRDIANVLSVPEGTVKSRLNRGRSELARILRRQRVLV
ncbi:MAG: sigma-70 family RNA polymerase sigma factor [Bryobacteraceae bacterium]|nr:sigma-70 family RNA polymerase sigma factor [Bryobacteraceae bacterium]